MKFHFLWLTFEIISAINVFKQNQATDFDGLLAELFFIVRAVSAGMLLPLILGESEIFRNEMIVKIMNMGILLSAATREVFACFLLLRS